MHVAKTWVVVLGDFFSAGTSRRLQTGERQRSGRRGGHEHCVEPPSLG